MENDPDKIISDYLVAYSAAHPDIINLPRIRYERGWYRFRAHPAGAPRYRRNQLEEMTKVLRNRAARTVNGPDCHD
jgi:hypothetical protein